MGRTRDESTLESFQTVWNGLFQGHSHLDSILSKLRTPDKGLIAESIAMILRSPFSITGREPWEMNPEALLGWKPAMTAFREIANLGESSLSRFEIAASQRDYPPEMVSGWKADWGESIAAQLVEALCEKPPLTVRVSRAVASSELKGFSACRIAPFGWTSPHYRAVRDTKLFKEGLAEIQDEGSQVLAWLALFPARAGDLLQPAPGPAIREVDPLTPERFANSLTVTDTCAGAGGKTLALSDLMLGKGKVFAYDISETKLNALKRRASKAGLRNIHTLALRAGRESESIREFHGKSGIVVVDAPCSGEGVLRRNPDIKWPRPRITNGTPLEELQRRLNATFSPLTAPEGRFVYMTCTFRKSETLDVIDAFLEDRTDFKREFQGFLGPSPMDGFFIASLRKTR